MVPVNLQGLNYDWPKQRRAPLLCPSACLHPVCPGLELAVFIFKVNIDYHKYQHHETKGGFKMRGWSCSQEYICRIFVFGTCGEGSNTLFSIHSFLLSGSPESPEPSAPLESQSSLMRLLFLPCIQSSRCTHMQQSAPSRRSTTNVSQLN